MESKPLVREFAHPGNEHRIMPVIRFNDEADREKIRWQVSSLKKQGCGGFFAYCERCDGAFSQTGEGTPAKLLSDWWWQTVDWMAEECAGEGLEFWVSDEEDWPSGAAGGLLLEERPEFQWRYLKPEESRFAGPQDIELDIYTKLNVAAVAYQRSGSKLKLGSLTDLSQSIAEGTLRWEVPVGEWYVAVYAAPL